MGAATSPGRRGTCPKAPPPAFPPGRVFPPAIVLGVALLAVLYSSPALGQGLPRYQVDAEVDLETHIIRAEMRVTLPEGDARLREHAVWHLPMNRFAEKDPRGPGPLSSGESVPFDSTETQRFNLFFPSGFSRGGTDILSIMDEAGNILPHRLMEAPGLTVGFSTRDALMEVAPPREGRTIVVRFETRVPERYFQGWSDGQLALSRWYPELGGAVAHPDAHDPYAPRAGYFSGVVRFSQAGMVFTGLGQVEQVSPGQPLRLPEWDTPLRHLSLIWLRERVGLIQHRYTESVSAFFQEDSWPVGVHALRTTQGFLRHVRERFGLFAHTPRVVLLELDLPPGTMIVTGNLVLLANSHFHTPRYFQRVFEARLAAVLGQIWFGEGVLGNRNTQAWLHMGLSGFLALDYYRATYGWDGGTHAVLDWINPRYREHYFELPVRQIMREGKDAPLSSPIYPPENDDRNTGAVLALKGPLVMRALEYQLGPEPFARGLNRFYHQFRGREAHHQDFFAGMTEETGQETAEFMALWFDGTPQVDFAVEDWRYGPKGEHGQVLVQLRRNLGGRLPADVRVCPTEGPCQIRRWEPGPEREELEFQIEGEVDTVSVDPGEFWPELNRRDNHSNAAFRVRPVFDFTKNREILVALYGAMGGNPVDGNLVGLGADIGLRENLSLYVLPIYGERTGLSNYEVALGWEDALTPGMDLDLTGSRYAGTLIQSIGVNYKFLRSNRNLLMGGLTLNRAQSEAISYVDYQGGVRSSLPGASNYAATDWNWELYPGWHYSHQFLISYERASPGFGSDFDYHRTYGELYPVWAWGSRFSLKLGLIRAALAGEAPLQNRPTLGDPLVLRGYPRDFYLSGDNIAAMRVDLGWVFSRAILFNLPQVREMSAFLFADAGRVWDQGTDYHVRPVYRDAGVALEVVMHTVAMFTFPLKVEVAWPYGNAEYTDPRLVFQGVLSF